MIAVVLNTQSTNHPTTYGHDAIRVAGFDTSEGASLVVIALVFYPIGHRTPCEQDAIDVAGFDISEGSS